ncbi:MAG: FtsQ-type POTRA domain-containing protein [Nitrospirae bacterium]|nr:FtsQ-type POTRA domain-containing protein [Nitrospirota bacterium]MBI3593845.1 FtsQ-type POTRA domain-containing protein [Nitrospirota bacterium]
MNKRQQNRKKKRHLLGITVKAIFILFLVLLGIAGGESLMDWLDTSSYFRIHEIDFQGLNRLTENQLNPYLGNIREQSLLKIDLDEYRRRLESEPWIKSVQLKRHFPDRVEIRIDEKTPISFIRDGGEVYLLDQEGKTITRDTTGGKGLPEIKGVLLSRFFRGDEKEVRKVQRGVEFIKSTMKPNFLIEREDLTRIVLQSEDDLEATIGGTSFLFRCPYSAQQWLRFLAIRNDLLARDIVIENVDLRYTGKVIVRPVKEKA